jgi:hypothetical protein
MKFPKSAKFYGPARAIRLYPFGIVRGGIAPVDNALAQGGRKMRKWPWIAALAVAFGSVGGYWYFTRTTPESGAIEGIEVARHVPRADETRAAEESEDGIEPIVVDRGRSAAAEAPAATDEGPLPRVVTVPDGKQPPRPEAGLVRVPRMPYADEPDSEWTRDPVERLLDPKLARPNLFAEIEKALPAEESEPKEVPANATPMADPMQHPAHDYHQNQCPYHGCPYPYRPIPRD